MSCIKNIINITQAKFRKVKYVLVIRIIGHSEIEV